MVLVAARTNVGRCRDVNEDTFGVTLPDSGAFLGPPVQSLELDAAVVLAVYDGHGSLPNGDCGSRIVAHAVHARVAALGASRLAAISSSLVDIVCDAGHDLFVRCTTDLRQRGLGTTATVAAVVERRASIAHVGDTRAFLFRDRRLTQITRDDSLASAMRDAGFIGPIESRWEHIITQALGVSKTVRPSSYEIELRAGDLLVLCSDGISPMLDTERLSAILDLEQSPEASCRALIEAAEAAGGHDNETVLIARI